MKRCVLLTGGAGYIGSCAAHLLLQHGYKVVVLDSFIYNQVVQLPGAIIVKGDVRDQNLLAMLFQTYAFDAVVHFAGFIEVGISVVDPARFYQNNVSGMITLLNTMRYFGVKNLVFSSSCAVYGIPQHMPLTEAHPCQPVNPYGRTKLALEFLAQDYATAYGMSFIALRYFNAAGALPEYGLGENHDPETHVIPLLLQSMIKQKPFTIFGVDYPTSDGSCQRDYIHILDIAYAHMRALQYLETEKCADFFNLGTGFGVSVLELVRLARQRCGMEIKINNAQRRKGDVAILIADAQKIQKLLGWTADFSNIESIIDSAWLWEQKKLLVKQGHCYKLDRIATRVAM